MHDQRKENPPFVRSLEADFDEFVSRYDTLINDEHVNLAKRLSHSPSATPTLES